MRIAATSDTHGMLSPKHVPKDIDLLVVAGDYCPNFSRSQYRDAWAQLNWIKDYFIPNVLDKIECPKLIVSGNHDWVHYVDGTKSEIKELYNNKQITYLQDDSIEINKFTFYGSPWTPWFHNWAFNFNCDFFKGRREAQACWESIPQNTDVLITHGPPYGILDKTRREHLNVGCKELLSRVKDVAPRLHFFGHIHEARGAVAVGKTLFANVSLVDLNMEPCNNIDVFII